MRNLKKFLALVLALMMTFSLMVTVNAAPATPTDFEDVSAEDTNYAEAINVLSALGIFNGYDIDGTTIFNPKGDIKRSEVAAILYRVAANDADDSQVGIYTDYDQFTDVPSDAWYAGAVNYCANAELVIGVNDEQTLYSPHNNVTGYQVLAMVLRLLGYDANDEFRGTGWQIRTASYARQVGLTDNIKEGTLGANATREMVAEIMFQALQAPTVSYNLLQNYYNNDVLIADTPANNVSYDNAIAADKLTLPLYGNLMYRNYGIVGKIAGEDDPYGRPTTAWVKDRDGDTMSSANGNAGKYIVNEKLNPDDVEITDDGSDAKGTWGATDSSVASSTDNIGVFNDVEAISITDVPMVIYTDGVTECQVSKDINNDKAVSWANITEYLNGEELSGTYVVEVGQYDQAQDDQSVAVARTGNFDARHTTTDFIGATGRTTEIYCTHLDENDPTNNEYRFVYIDTLLGVVESTTTELADANGHVIREAMAKVTIGNDLVTLDLPNPNGKFAKGDLVLVQTPNGDLESGGKTLGTTKGEGLYKVDNPDTAPLDPRDLPDTGAEFVWDSTNSTGKNARLLPNPTEKVRVTITATEGSADLKMGIRADDGNTYWASNAFLAGRNVALQNDGTTYDNDKRSTDYDGTNGTSATVSVNKTVPEDWYDIDNPKFGITNSMIGSTYDIVLDQNGYIVGMDKVRDETTSNVGIITGIDAERIGLGKYVPVVTAYMADGAEAEFKLFGIASDGGDGDTAIGHFQAGTKLTATEKKLLGTYNSVSAAEAAWDSDEMYENLGVGSLVMFEEYTTEGITAHFICDFDAKALTLTAAEHSTLFGKGDGTSGPLGAKDEDGVVLTGNAWSLGTDVADYSTDEPNAATLSSATGQINTLLNSKSTIFVAEGEYRYNTGNVNEGSNVDIEYTVYEGFKNMPTITTGAASNVLFQQLTNHPAYVFIYAEDTNEEFNIMSKSTIAVDDSYLVLSRGATFAAYSEYNVLKNGEQTVLKVSNANANLNTTIENAMAGKLLITVTNTNKNGYATSVATLNSLMATDNKTQANTGTDVAGNRAVGTLAGSTLLPGWKVGAGDFDFISTAAQEYYWSVSESNDVLTIREVDYDDGDHTKLTAATGIMYLTLAEGCTYQLVNLDLKTVRPVEKAEALDYINGVSPASSVKEVANGGTGTWQNQDLAPHDFTYEFDANGYVCNIYVIENTPTATT